MCTEIVSQLNMEQLLTCPYEAAHRIRRFKIRLHLNKCRKNHPCSDMKICPYNVDHIVPSVEFDFHCEICEDRIKGDRYRYEIADDTEPHFDDDEQPPSSGLLPLDAIPEVAADDEDWSAPRRAPVISINRVIQDSSKEKKVMLLKQGATKSERKAHYMEERRRHNIFEDTDQPSTSRAAGVVPANQPLRMPRTASVVSTQSSVSTVIEAARSATKPPVAAAQKTQNPVSDENLKPQQVISLGRGRTPGGNKPVSPQSEPKVGVLSESKTNAATESFKQFGIDKDGFCTIPIPSKGRGRKLNIAL